MTPKVKWTIAFIGVVILIIVIILYAYRDKIFGSANKKNSTGNNNNNAQASFPLKYGSNNMYVKKLQQYLLSKSPNCLPKYGADGDWGTETEACANSVLNNNIIDYDYYKNYIA